MQEYREPAVERLGRRLELLEGILVVNRMRGVQRVATALGFADDSSGLRIAAERALDWFGIPYQSETRLSSRFIAPTLAYVLPPTPKHTAQAFEAVRSYGVLVICWTAAERKRFLSVLDDFAMQSAVHAIVVVTQKKRFAKLPTVLRGKPVETVTISKKVPR